jgi:tRNA-modifying protein YgfZ
MIIHAMNQAFRIDQVLQGVAPLPHWGVIQVVGDDAAKFLHGQLTQDFALLDTSQARLAALCSAKGRMLASFVGFKRSETEILLLCSRDILAPTLKRLSMFVLRAKAKLVDASDQFALAGLAGDAVAAVAAGGGLGTWARQEAGSASLIGLDPVQGVARALWVAPAGTPLPAGPTLAPDLWQWSEVASGVATITAPIVEAFVPQMLNYESVGGVNFKKGCYPGQEVVARSQFRGTLKRRAFLVHADAPLVAGQEVFHAGDADQPCGTVAQAAAAPSGGYDAIVSMQVSAATQAGLAAGTADGPALTLHALPYALLEDI